MENSIAVALVAIEPVIVFKVFSLFILNSLLYFDFYQFFAIRVGHVYRTGNTGVKTVDEPECEIFHDARAYSQAC